METDERVELKVTIERGSGEYWNVHVDDATGHDFAMSSARGLDLALRGAVPYMAAAAEEAGGPMARALAEAQARQDRELAEAGRMIAEEYERQHGVAPLLKCPDDGACHHDCASYAGTTLRCWRVHNAAPLSGVFEGDRWPEGALPTIVTEENP